MTRPDRAEGRYLETLLANARGRLVVALAAEIAAAAGEENAAARAGLVVHEIWREILQLLDRLEELPHDVGQAAEWDAIRRGGAPE